MAKHIPQRSKQSFQMREREKRIELEQMHEAELIEDILNEFKSFDENAPNFSLDLNDIPEPEYGFEMPSYVKELFSGNTVDLADDPVPTVADFKLDPKMFENDEDEALVEPEPEFELDIEPDEEIDFFAELFVKNSPSIAANNEKTASVSDIDIDVDIDEYLESLDEPVEEEAPVIEESAGVEITEDKYPQDEPQTYFSEDDDFFSTRELRSEFFTQEFDDRFREMFAGSLDNEAKKLGGRKMRSAMVTPEELTSTQEIEEPVEEEIEVPTPAPKKKKKGTALWTIMLVLFVGIFLFAGYQFVSTYITQLNEKKALNSLADIVTMAENGSSTTVEYNGVTYEAAEDDGSGKLLKYQQLAGINDDMIGWLSIPDTDINYPVMYTPDDPEYYLHRDFEGDKAASGMLFVDANCDIENGDNQIIYGHNMKNDTMFGTLDKYSDHRFWAEHQYIHYDSLYEEHVYQVVCVFEARVLNQDEKGFRYYRFYGSENEEEFNEYVEGIKNLELYDTGIDISYGDKLITLSTCAYFTNEGRFVVVAKQIS